MKKIYVDGTFDLLHIGHIEFFKKAKEFGNYLIVGVIAEKGVESYKRKPILTLEERCKMLENIKLVDKVIPDCPLGGISEEFLEKYSIDMVIYAGNENDWQDHYKIPIERKMMKYINYGCNNISTSKILKRIKCRENLNI
tara:strand:- start:1 stop:420 length:420 start_codon:yes stop_codon:yes gene_type:complete